MDVVLVAIANLVAGFLLGCTFSRGQPRRRCVERSTGPCDAFASPSCSDGRCRHHCHLRCDCLPIGDGVLRVIEGGRGKPSA